MSELSEKEKQQLASDLFDKMESEGVNYYFTLYGPDLGALKKLGFDVEKIKEAAKGAAYLDGIFSELEEMGFDVDG